LHPSAYFSTWNGLPPFGAAELLLLLLSLVAGLATEGVIRLHGTCSRRKPQSRDWTNLLLIPVVVQIIWVGAAFFSLGLIRMVNNGSSFELIFSVLAFGGAPCIITWIAFSMSCVSYAAWICWQLFSALLHSWAIWLVWIGLHIACHLNGWEALLAAMPLVIPLVAFDVNQAMPNSAETFQACYPWRRASGERVIVFYSGYSGPKNRHEIERIVVGAEETLCKVYALLGQEALKFKVMMFLCRDQEQHRKIFSRNHDASAPMASGYAHHDSVSLVYGPWREICRTTAHEFCHIVRRHRISPELLGILDEGLSDYVEEKLFPGGPVPAITLVPNLQVIANTSVFFEWMYTKNPALRGSYCYRHAHAFPDYLISRYGMPQYLELCRVTGASKEPTEGTKLAAAIEQIYGMPITQMEKLWRAAWPGTWTTGQTKLAFEPPDEPHPEGPSF